MKKIILLLLCISSTFYNTSNAVVKIVSKKVTNTSIPPGISFRKIKPPKQVIIKNQRSKQLYIDGYIDSKYVRLVVEFENNKNLTGYLFENNKTKKYIYGEKINNVLYIYNTSGQQFTVILSNH